MTCLSSPLLIFVTNWSRSQIGAVIMQYNPALCPHHISVKTWSPIIAVSSSVSFIAEIAFLNFLIQNEIIVELEQYSNERQNLNDITNQPDQKIKEISLNIQKTTQNIKTPDLNIQLAINDNFKIIIKEYNDAQELLLADPIHEVNQETGWSPEKSSLNNNH